MKVELSFDAVHWQIGNITIFMIAKNGRAENIHMRPKLMLPPRHRLQ